MYSYAFEHALHNAMLEKKCGCDEDIFDMPARDIEQIDSRIVYENRWMKVREDRILRRSGSTGILAVEAACRAIAPEMSMSEVHAMMCDGRIKDATTVAVFGLLKFKNLIS